MKLNPRVSNKSNYYFILTLVILFGIFLCITAALYFVRLGHITTFYGMPDIDTDGTIWYFFVRTFSTQHSINFNFTNKIFAYPFGYDVTYIPFFSLIYEFNLLLIKLLGSGWHSIILVGNITSLISYPLEGIATFCLIYYFIRNKLISFVCSLIFTFSYYSILIGADFLSLDHLEFIPLYFLSLFYFLDKRTRAGLVLSVLVFAIMFGSNAYWAFFSGIFSIPIILFYRKGKWREKALVFIIYYLSIFIGFILTNLNFFQSQLYNFNHHLLAISGKTETASDKLLSILTFFTPSNFQLIYRFGNIGDHFLGFTALTLGLIGIVFGLSRTRKYALFFLCFLISIIITVYIPGLSFLNNIYFLFFSMFRSISRINIFTSLFLALMAGLSLQYIFTKYEFNHFKKGKILVILILTLAILIEGLNIDQRFYKTTDFQKIAKLYHPIKENKNIHVIAGYPMELSDGTSGIPPKYELLGQVIHNKTLVTGASPFMRDSLNLFPLINNLNNKITIPTLAKYKVDTIIVYNKLILHDNQILKKLRNDPRLDYLGRFIEPGDNSGYISQNERSRDISVFQIKKVVQENKTRNFSPIQIEDGKGTIIYRKPSPYKYQITLFDIKGPTTFSVNEPYTSDWKLFGGIGTVDFQYLFKKPLSLAHDQTFMGINSWTIDPSRIAETLPPSSFIKNRDRSITVRITAYYYPNLIASIENDISVLTYGVLIAFLLLSLYRYAFL